MFLRDFPERVHKFLSTGAHIMVLKDEGLLFHVFMCFQTQSINAGDPRDEKFKPKQK